MALSNLRTGRLVKNALIFKSLKWARAVHPTHGRFSKANSFDMSKGIYLPEADAFLTGTARGDLAILNKLEHVGYLRSELGATFRNEGGKWIAEFQGLAFPLSTEDDAWILWEIFVRGAYDCILAKPPTAVIDIGMNFGVASVFFARKFECPVHSYELFPPTFERAQETLRMNPSIAARVHANCYGLSDRDDIFDLHYDPSQAGELGLFFEGSNERARKVAVEVRRASDSLRTVLEEAKGSAFAKIDCEGSEFAVLRDLEAAGLLGGIGTVAMEWHRRAGDPQELREILGRAGFTMFFESEPGGDIGMIRAVRA